MLRVLLLDRRFSMCVKIHNKNCSQRWNQFLNNWRHSERDAVIVGWKGLDVVYSVLKPSLEINKNVIKVTIFTSASYFITNIQNYWARIGDDFSYEFSSSGLVEELRQKNLSFLPYCSSPLPYPPTLSHLLSFLPSSLTLCPPSPLLPSASSKSHHHLFLDILLSRPNIIFDVIYKNKLISNILKIKFSCEADRHTQTS